MNEGGGNRRFPPLVTKWPDIGLVVDVGSQKFVFTIGKPGILL